MTGWDRYYQAPIDVPCPSCGENERYMFVNPDDEWEQVAVCPVCDMLSG